MNEIEVRPARPAGWEYLPALSIDRVSERYNALVAFTKSILRKGVDYGVVGGIEKPTLLKPGAEKLACFFGLEPSQELMDSVEDWDSGVFYYRYRCVLRRGGIVVGVCEGSANSREVRYRYRTADRKCPRCGQPTIVKGRPEYGGGWLCFAKRGGCGAKYKEGDPQIEGQPSGRMENPEPYDLVNTLQKQAQKRAYVGAVLMAVNASEFFTQDVEDMPFVGDGTIYEPPTAVESKESKESKESSESVAEVPDATEQPPPPPEPTIDYTLRDKQEQALEALRALGRKIGGARGRAAAMGLLKKYGAHKVTDLHDVKVLERLIAEATAAQATAAQVVTQADTAPPPTTTSTSPAPTSPPSPATPTPTTQHTTAELDAGLLADMSDLADFDTFMALCEIAASEAGLREHKVLEAALAGAMKGGGKVFASLRDTDTAWRRSVLSAIQSGGMSTIRAMVDGKWRMNP